MIVGSTTPPPDRLRLTAGMWGTVQSLRFARPPHPPKRRRPSGTSSEADERLVRADELLLLGGDAEV
jgi:hypothetical protein